METNVVIFHFSNMADESLEEHQRIKNSFSDVLQPSFVEDIVTIQPS